MPLFMVEVHTKCEECKTSLATFGLAVHAKSAAAAMRYVTTDREWTSDGVFGNAVDDDLVPVRAKRAVDPRDVRGYRATDGCWHADPYAVDDVSVAQAFFDAEDEGRVPRYPYSRAKPATPEQERAYDAAVDKHEQWQRRKEREFRRLQKGRKTP